MTKAMPGDTVKVHYRGLLDASLSAGRYFAMRNSILPQPLNIVDITKDMSLLMPKTLRLYSTNGCIEIEALTRYPNRLMLMLFIVGWVFITLLLLGVGLINYPNILSYFIFICSAIFLLALTYLIVLFLMALFGRIRVSIFGDNIVINIGIGLFNVKRRINIDKGFQIYKYDRTLSDSECDDYAIFLKGDKEISFGKQLDEEQIDCIVWIIGKIGRRLGLLN